MALVELQAKEAKVGKEYTSPKGNVVKVYSQDGEKTLLLVKVGNGYSNSKPFQVPGTYILKGQGSMASSKKDAAEAKKAAKAERHAAKTAAKEAKKLAKKEAKAAKAPRVKKEAKPKRDRLPKMKAETGTPTVVIKGIKFREHYRNRLSEQRAILCQKAAKDNCFCRCGGLLHGKSHKAWFEAEAQLFEKLNGPVPAAKIVALVEELVGAKIQK